MRRWAAVSIEARTVVQDHGRMTMKATQVLSGLALPWQVQQVLGRREEEGRMGPPFLAAQGVAPAGTGTEQADPKRILGLWPTPLRIQRMSRTLQARYSITHQESL